MEYVMKSHHRSSVPGDNEDYYQKLSHLFSVGNKGNDY